MILKKSEIRGWVLHEKGFKCNDCGSTENLHIHHIKPKSHFPELEFETDNLEVLCKDCHYKKHKELNKIYPKKKTQPVERYKPEPTKSLTVEEKIEREKRYFYRYSDYIDESFTDILDRLIEAEGELEKLEDELEDLELQFDYLTNANREKLKKISVTKECSNKAVTIPKKYFWHINVNMHDKFEMYVLGDKIIIEKIKED